MNAAAPTDYQALSDSQLADTFAVIKKAAAAEEKRLEAATAELVRRGKGQYFGATYTVVREENTQRRFDTKAVVAEMGQAWVDARKKLGKTARWVASLNDQTATALEAIALPPPKPKTRRRKAA